MSEQSPSTAVGSIGADRACAGCGFNLFGQPILRETHYGMLVSRCPECGSVAALQEYPALGRWARRWAGVLAGFWLGVIVLAFLGTAGFALGMTFSAVNIAAEPVAQRLMASHKAWEESLAEDEAVRTAPSLFGTTGLARWDQPSPDWPALADISAVFADSGGILAAADRSVVWFWVIILATSAPLGLLWGLALQHQPRWRAALVPAAAVGVAGVLMFAGARVGRGTPLTFAELATGALSPAIGTLTLSVVLASLAAWCVLARPIGRLAVRIALPPRQRVPFTVLWTSAGMPPPKPR